MHLQRAFYKRHLSKAVLLKNRKEKKKHSISRCWKNRCSGTSRQARSQHCPLCEVREQVQISLSQQGSAWRKERLNVIPSTSETSTGVSKLHCCVHQGPGRAFHTEQATQLLSEAARSGNSRSNILIYNTNSWLQSDL